jgi:transposase-like protein
MVNERLRQAVRIALISILVEEVTAFIGAKPYERNEQRRDQRNGHYLNASNVFFEQFRTGQPLDFG